MNSSLTHICIVFPFEPCLTLGETALWPDCFLRVVDRKTSLVCDPILCVYRFPLIMSRRADQMPLLLSHCCQTVLKMFLMVTQSFVNP